MRVTFGSQEAQRVVNADRKMGYRPGQKIGPNGLPMWCVITEHVKDNICWDYTYEVEAVSLDDARRVYVKYRPVSKDIYEVLSDHEPDSGEAVVEAEALYG